MKRLWIACGILALVFAATLYNTHYLSGFTNELTTLLTRAEIGAEDGDWETAGELTRQAVENWDRHAVSLHVLLRHTEVDDVNTSFQEVREFINCQEGGEYSAANARLIAQIELLYEAEQLTLKNVL